MSKDFEEKTSELINLAEASVDERLEAAEEKNEKVKELRDACECAPKKKGNGGKIILAVVGVLLAILLAVGGASLGILSCATKDEMPVAPSTEDVDMTSFALSAVSEVIKENTITIDNGVVNSILANVKGSVNASTDMIRFDDLFCKIADGKSTLYARVYIDTLDINGFELKLDRSFPVHADFTVGFEDATKSVIVDLGEVYCGKIKIPQTVIDAVLAKVQLPAEVSVKENGIILYDTSTLDAKIDEAMVSVISEKIDGFLGELLAEFATNLTDVELTGATIEGENIVINGSVF